MGTNKILSKLYLCNQNKDDFKSVWIVLFHEDSASAGPTLDIITQQPFCLSGVLVYSVFYFGNLRKFCCWQKLSCMSAKRHIVFFSTRDCRACSCEWVSGNFETRCSPKQFAVVNRTGQAGRGIYTNATCAEVSASLSGPVWTCSFSKTTEKRVINLCLGLHKTPNKKLPHISSIFCHGRTW